MTIRLPGRRSAALLTLLTTCSVTAMALAAPAAGVTPAAKKGTTLVGTVSWTTTITTALDVPEGDATTGTETTSVSMKVKMSKRPAAATWQVEDNGSTYAATYTLASERKERDFFGTVDCTVTHAVNATAGGPLPKRPTSTSAPAMFSNITPGTSALSAKTKVMTLTPILRWEGTDTVTYTGSGNSPCTNAQDVDPVDGSLAPTSDARKICFPKGTKPSQISASAGTLVGAWNNGKKTFVFDCTQSWPDGEGRTITLEVKGALKLK
jgi:hypothetical protein